jgi:hypothetical protein
LAVSDDDDGASDSGMRPAAVGHRVRLCRLAVLRHGGRWRCGRHGVIERAVRQGIGVGLGGPKGLDHRLDEGELIVGQVGFELA